MSFQKRSGIIFPGAVVACLSIQGSVLAQGLEEIVVTAQKRSESVQDVPIAISAFSAERMEAMNVKSMMDLEQVTPGFITGSLGGYRMPFLRGVGSTISFVNGDSSVATFVDGYYLGHISGIMQDLYDAERIEVLKGPQAILYGRNASGGAVNFVTRKPNQDALEGKVAVAYGSDDEKEFKTYVSSPVTEELSFSVSGVFRERDSYVRYVNPAPGQKTAETVSAVRVKFLWEPLDWYRAELSLGYSESESAEALALLPIRGALNEATALGGTVTYMDTNKYSENTLHFNDVRQTMFYLTQEAEVKGLTIRSLSGVSDTKQSGYHGVDGSALSLLETGVNPSQSKLYSQEFQILSDPDRRFSWIAGSSYHYADESFLNGTNSLPALNQAVGMFHTQTYDSRVSTRAFAAFFEGKYAMTERLSVSGGMRWTREEKRMPENSLRFDGIPTPSPFFDCTFAGLTFGVDCGGAAFGGLPEIPPAFVGAGAAALNGVNQVIPSHRTTWREVTFRAVIDYALTDNVNVYYSRSRGFKGGVYNLPALVPGVENPPVNPEILDSNEIGLKGDFLDGRLRVNAAAFIYDLTDTQAQVVQGGAGGTTVLASAGDSSLKGGEVDIFFSATDKLLLTAGVAVIDSEYKDFTNFPAQVQSPSGGFTGAGGNSTVMSSVVGNDMVRAPELSANLTATYTTSLETLGLGGFMSMTGVWYYNDGYCFESSCRGVQESYDVVNASLSYTTADEHWKISGWVNNLFDEKYLSQYLQVPTGDLGLLARPRNGGIRVEYFF